MNPTAAVPKVGDDFTAADTPDDAARDQPAWVVHKFGGSSVADAERIRRVAAILAARGDERQLVVVSAVKGDTDKLTSLLDSSKHDPAGTEIALEALHQAHRRLIAELIPGSGQAALIRDLAEDIARIEALLHYARASGGSDDALRAEVTGYGEIWTSRLLAAYLHTRGVAARELPSRDVIVLANPDDASSVHWEASRQAIEATGALGFHGTLVAPGFVARSLDGKPTTLGRNGSDCSAAILAALAGASLAHIWTDVDGILVADPRRLPRSATTGYLSFDEAATLARLGAKVLHPATLEIAARHGIKLFIRNSFNPDGACSLVQESVAAASGVKGISAVDQVLVLTLAAEKTVHLDEAAHELLRGLREEGIVPLAVLRQHPCRTTYVLPGDRRDAALRAGRKLLELPHLSHHLEPLSWSERHALLGIVLAHPTQRARASAKFLRTLDHIGVTVLGSLQDPGGSGTSVLIERHELQRALRCVHEAFCATTPEIPVAVVGAGNIGRELLRQVAELPSSSSNKSASLSVRVIADSRRLLTGERSLTLADWNNRPRSQEKLDLAGLPELLRRDSTYAPIIVDATASAAVAQLHAGWLRAGAHVVTANKLGVADGSHRSEELRRKGPGRGSYAYETTVGAGLPVIRTLRDLCDSGDRIVAIRGVLSGTLSYLFNAFDGSRPFSALLREAAELGITEPDARTDLSGVDVARKLLVLAREAGLRLELADIEVESLIPDSLASCSVAEFFGKCGRLDDTLLLRLLDAHASGCVLRYVAELKADGSACVGLKPCSRDDGFAALRYTENIVEITSERYRCSPLVIRGPGAGSGVTAAGVLSDVLKLAEIEAGRL